MSYEIIKHIKIKDGKVFIKCASSNVYPKIYDECESQSLTKILAEQGEQALNIEILKEYENGNFQSRGINNKFTRALKILYNILADEYEAFNWRTEKENEKREARESQAYKDLLQKALNTKLPKEKFIVMKKDGTRFIYARKTTSRHLFYTANINEAKVFDFKQEADRVLKCYGVINGEVVRLNTTPSTAYFSDGTSQEVRNE